MNDESLSLAEYHRQHFGPSETDIVAFNQDQRVVVIGQQIPPEIWQTAVFLRSKGTRVTCVEFDRQFSSREISLPLVTKGSFLASCDENGRAVFSRMLELSREKSLPIHWGVKGFSMNVDLDGTHVAFCYGYPPNAVYKQSFYAALRDARTIGKTAIPEEAVQALEEQVRSTGLFTPAGQSLKCPIERRLTDTEVDAILAWCAAVADAIREYGLRQ